MIIYRYILKNHLAPFLFGNVTLISIFLLQFLMKFADRLVGKGLGFWLITKLIAYNLAWMVVLVVPMAVLVATLMAFGSMAHDNEVAIFKATGISLYKMIMPPLLAGAFLCFLLIQFNNYVYPNANHAARILMQDISRKKPTLSLVPGVFSQEVRNYSILARDIEQESNTLKDLTIYDDSGLNKKSVVTAKSGKIYFAKNQKKLILDLVDGEIHESDMKTREIYRRLRFEKHKIAMDGSQFTFEQSTPGGRRGDRELGAQDILLIIDSLEIQKNHYIEEYQKAFAQHFEYDFVKENEKRRFDNNNKDHILIRAEEKVKNQFATLKQKILRVEYKDKEINKFWVEVHKKYAIPGAIIVFILIGVPLGTMTRKGGFGVAAGISLLFFLIYWAFLIGGEKLADRGLLSPFWGMWSANFVLGALGVFLLVRAAKERVTLDFSFLSRIIPKSFRNNVGSDENS
ncbi:MAG: LptF/LptG family permease [Melioribacteraceae bacterium]|nr:LptF/LptG family permease [Melioribacteraceae bacterium]MCF8411962.1 LptF/LptG family permease [Melioribacteraceae bacterium]MCF8432433.1 LptF/LptG family permease [Melioribacteraceae bacterium]